MFAHFLIFKASSGAIEETELVYFPSKTGPPTWGRVFSLFSHLQYEVEVQELPENRRVKGVNYVPSGYSPNVTLTGFSILLKRKSTPYLLSYYLPSSLLVGVSWVSYAIPLPRAVPGRITLLVTTFLALANIANAAFVASPTNQGINFLQVIQIQSEFIKMSIPNVKRSSTCDKIEFKTIFFNAFYHGNIFILSHKKLQLFADLDYILYWLCFLFHWRILCPIEPCLLKTSSCVFSN